MILGTDKVTTTTFNVISAGDSQLVPMSTRLMSTRTHVNLYPCQLVPPIDCQLVPQVMSTRTTSDVNSYKKGHV